MLRLAVLFAACAALAGCAFPTEQEPCPEEGRFNLKISGPFEAERSGTWALFNAGHISLVQTRSSEGTVVNLSRQGKVDRRPDPGIYSVGPPGGPDAEFDARLYPPRSLYASDYPEKGLRSGGGSLTITRSERCILEGHFTFTAMDIRDRMLVASGSFQAYHFSLYQGGIRQVATET